MFTYLFNYVHNDCRQLLDFSWRKKRNTEDNNEVRKQGAMYIIITSDVSRVFRKKFDVTRQQISWICSVMQATSGFTQP